MVNLQALLPFTLPFPHWVAEDFLDEHAVRAINRSWPTLATPGFNVETGVAAKSKGAMLFPERLPHPAMELAEYLNGPEALGYLSGLVEMDLLPDPWLHEGPRVPMLGGGLHEIFPGGLLKIHVDFERHPSGLKRVANLLIYLNEDWNEGWGGDLELHGSTVKTIAPIGGRAVLFVTTPESFHGHPHPLACPIDRTRRSLALCYYAKSDDANQRPKTVYRR